MLYLGLFLAAFIVTGMMQQLFPDGRFPFTTTLLVIVFATLGAYLGHVYLGSFSLFTGAFIGAGVASGLLFYLLHSTGWLAQEPLPKDPDQKH